MSEINFNQDQHLYPVIQILLMGRNGSEKSSSGNTILGENLFKEHEAEVCEGQTQISGKQVAVIVCPDLLDPDLNKEQLETMKDQLISRCSAGLSEVLLTVPLEKSVQNEEEILDYIQCLFGPEVQKYIMILFTLKDDVYEMRNEQEKHQDHEDLQRLVTECGGKNLCFYYNKKNMKGQVQELLQKIEVIVTENGGMFIMEQMRRRHSMVSIVNFSGETPSENEMKQETNVKKDRKTGSGQIDTMISVICKNGMFDGTEEQILEIWLDKNMYKRKNECEWFPQSEQQKTYGCSDEIPDETHNDPSLGLFVIIPLMIIMSVFFITRKTILRDPESDEKTIIKGQIYDLTSFTAGI